MVDVWDPLPEGGWNPCFSRVLNDWEVEEAKISLEHLHGKRVLGDVDDMVVWTETKSGKFSAKSDEDEYSRYILRKGISISCN